MANNVRSVLELVSAAVMMYHTIVLTIFSLPFCAACQKILSMASSLSSTFNATAALQWNATKLEYPGEDMMAISLECVLVLQEKL